MSYQSNYKLKNIQNSKCQDGRFKALTIDDNLYLLALVCSGDVESLKQVTTQRGHYELTFNYSFRLPIHDLSNLVEELNQLLETGKSFYGIDDFIRRNKLMRRLLQYYNIQKLKPNLIQEHDGYYSASSSVSTSFNSSLGSYSYDEGIFMSARTLGDAHEEDNTSEIVNDAIVYNKFFDLTFLHVAILLENYEMIRFLQRYGSGIGALRPYHMHSIHLALYRSNNTILGTLLAQLGDDKIDNGALDKLIDDRGYTPLQIAIHYANEDALDLLCTYGASLDHETQPLIWALENVEVPYAIVARLLKLGADTNVVDKTHGYTPLIVAALADRADLIQVLIKYGADVNKTIENQDACCALQVAIDRSQQTNNFDVFNVLLKAGANPTFYKDQSSMSGPLIDAISMNSKYMVETLLRHGANPHTDVNGTYSPMCTACFLGNSEMVELLLRHKVDPVLKCKNSNTPLTVAISMNHDKIINLLLLFYKTKESVNAQDANGDHALLYAALNKKAKLVKDLLKLGADTNAENKFNATAFWYSIYNCDSESFHALLPFVKDFNKSSNGVEYNNFETTPELIYRNSVSYVELADEKDFYEAIYLLKLLGATVPQRVVGNLIFKFKNLKYALKAKIIEETPKVSDTLRRLKCLIHFLCTPLTLSRLCRLHFTTKNSKNELTTVVPLHLEEFINFKKM